MPTDKQNINENSPETKAEDIQESVKETTEDVSQKQDQDIKENKTEENKDTKNTAPENGDKDSKDGEADKESNTWTNEDKKNKEELKINTTRPIIRAKWYHIVAAVIVLIVIFLFVGWLIKPSRVMKVALLDKTMLSYSEDEKIIKENVYRKHQGFYWILNQQKYVKPDGTNYDYRYDYFGPMLDNEGSFDHNVELSSIEEKPDLVYLADAYGLGNDTYGYYNGGSPLNSGITDDDMSVITFAYENGATVLAETALFSSPLSDSVREQLTTLLGVTPTKWIGRYIVDLQDFTDVPDWAPPMYEQQEGVEWRFTGPGILLISTDGKIIVLEQNTDFNTKELLTIYFNEEYKKEFSGCRKCNFYNWFELVTPTYGTETLATFNFDLNAVGMEKIREISKTPRFCAISRKKEKGHAPVYFFSGDFNDYVSGQRFGKFLFSNEIFQLFSYDRQGDISNFYWNFYNPMIRHILWDVNTTQYTEEEEEHKEVSRINENKIQVNENDKWKTINLKAVSFNADEPGKDTYPKDFSFYEQLVEDASSLGANALAAKDLLPPEFYTAVARHNKSGDDKIYIMQDITPPEDLEVQDYLSEDGLAKWKDRINTVLAALHGGTKAQGKKLGDASYFTDVSKYILSVNIDPKIDSLNFAKIKNANTYSYGGEFTNEKKGLEGFCSYLYDTLENSSYSNYGYMTTCSVRLPMEMIKGTSFADRAALDLSNIPKTDYKEYYFRDTLYDSDICRTTESGENAVYNKCASVFNELTQNASPVLISGISVSSVNGIYGKQAVTEKEQGERLTQILWASRDTSTLGCTIYDLNDSWSDVSDSMEPFVSEDSAGAMWRNTCDEKQTTGLVALQAKEPKEAGLVLTDDDIVQSMSMYSNSEYMYITLSLLYELDYKENVLFVGLDTFQRNDGEYYYAKDFTPTSLSGMEFTLRFEDKQNAALYAINTYSRTGGSIYTEESYTGSYVKVNDLSYGGFDVSDNQFYQTGATIYVRIPWTWLNFSDPSKKLVINDRNYDGIKAKTATTNGLLLSVMVGERAEGDLMYGFPEKKQDPGYKTYKWQNWEKVEYEFRQKESFKTIKAYFSKN